MKNVSWVKYAESYDIMCDANPEYQIILSIYEELINSFSFKDGSIIVDIGAGTGNFSIILAEKFPKCRILHVDSDLAMNLKAAEKIKSRKIANIEIINVNVNDFKFEENAFSFISAVHSLYTFENPKK